MFNSPKESENYNISKNGSEYNINFIYSNSSLEIKITDKEPFTKSTYQKIFSLEELAKKKKMSKMMIIKILRLVIWKLLILIII